VVWIPHCAGHGLFRVGMSFALACRRLEASFNWSLIIPWADSAERVQTAVQYPSDHTEGRPVGVRKKRSSRCIIALSRERLSQAEEGKGERDAWPSPRRTSRAPIHSQGTVKSSPTLTEST